MKNTPAVNNKTAMPEQHMELLQAIRNQKGLYVPNGDVQACRTLQLNGYLTTVILTGSAGYKISIKGIDKLKGMAV